MSPLGIQLLQHPRVGVEQPRILAMHLDPHVTQTVRETRLMAVPPRRPGTDMGQNTGQRGHFELAGKIQRRNPDIDFGMSLCKATERNRIHLANIVTRVFHRRLQATDRFRHQKQRGSRFTASGNHDLLQHLRPWIASIRPRKIGWERDPDIINVRQLITGHPLHAKLAGRRNRGLRKLLRNIQIEMFTHELKGPAGIEHQIIQPQRCTEIWMPWLARLVKT